MDAATVFSRIISTLEGKLKPNNEYQCRCPCPDHEDKNPSCCIKLSENKLLVHCLAGCSQKSVIDALKTLNLWPTSGAYFRSTSSRMNPRKHTTAKQRPPGIPAKRKTTDKATGKIDVKTFIDFWPYKDREGKISGYAVRFENDRGEKDVVPYFKQNSRGWYAGSPPSPRPLYGLEHLAKASQKLTIWVVEGEKCAEALQAHRRLTVTSQGGTNTAGLADWSPLAGRKIRIWPDYDQPGQKYAEDVKLQLEALMPPSDIEVVDTASLGLEKKEDAFDWLQKHKPEELNQIPLVKEKKGLRKTDVGKLIEIEFQPEEFILEPWLPTQSLCMIHARPGVGKTFLAVGIAFAVAAGDKFLKWKAPQPRDVLYIDGEMAGDDIKKRYERIIVEHNYQHPGKRLEIITPDINENIIPDIGTVKGQKLIESQITAECELVILDNLSCLQRSGDEDKSHGWACMQEWLLHLKRKGKAILLIHHSGKGGSQRGTSKREDALNTILTLKRNPLYEFEEGACFEVHYEKARSVYGPTARPFEAKLEIVEGVWTVRDLKIVTYDQVVRMMKDGCKQVEIAQMLGKTKGLISQHVKRAKGKGDL